ncbi:hypothetical protein K439DRAFT_567112 [Ramaria rubella]|nr:hypothetical protein K439DRAFT_567112 [Ramaria rubella]
MALTTRKGTAFNNPSKATRQQIPPFLSKLYHMVNDPNTDSLIRWSDAGDSFYVHDHERFAKDVLPHWFKHGNFGSFVRQLNNYGFHKVPHLQQGVLRSDGETEVSHFENQHFQRGQSDLLCLIQRKKQVPNDGREESPDFKEPVASSSAQANGAESESTHNPNNVKGAVLDINGVVNGIQAIKRHQHAISAELKDLHQSNQGLWQEAFAARERHKKHHDTITRILKFLAGVFGQTANGSHAQEVPRDASNESSDSTAMVPRRGSRLMIESGVDLEGKAAEVLNGMHLNMSDFMEPLDFEGGQANDGDRFVTIEPSGSPGPSTPQLESRPPPSNPPSPQPLHNKPTASILQPTTSTPQHTSTSHTTNPSPTYPFSISNHNRLSSADLSQVFTPDFTFAPDTNSSALSSNVQSDQPVQNAFTSLLNNPAQLQRILAALQSQLPVSIPSDSGPDGAHISRETVPSPPPFNLRQPSDGQLSPGSTLSLLSAATNMGALSLPTGDDPATLNELAQSSHQLQKSYKEAADVEEDVNTLQGHIDSLIESLGLDPSAAAILRGEGQQEHQHADDEIVSSTAPHLNTLPLSDANPDFDFDAFLSQDFDPNAGLNGFNPGTPAFDAVTQRNGVDRLGAFLDEVQSVSNESDVTAASAPEGEPLPSLSTMRKETTVQADKSSKKRKSDLAQLGDPPNETKAARTKKKR